ncbi:MAG TPA: hypothetical protein VK956_10805 [Verrucomicrobium sp.]|nr:hypothetical protein [Verrucomicrobium sp.]
MHHTTLLLTAALAFFLCSCSTSSTTLAAVNKAYKGKNADDFFINHGPPASQYVLTNGGKVYRWNSSITSYHMGGLIRTTGSVDAYGNYSGTSFVTGGGAVDVYTIVRILADPSNKVQSIAVEKDTIGKWTLSRFSEVFRSYTKKTAS